MAKKLVKLYKFNPGPSGSGTIQLPGHFSLNDLLLITNVTSNEIIYNFADSNFAGTTVDMNRNNSADFPQTLQNSDGITTVVLAADTSSMNANDELQVFVDSKETVVRFDGIGIDAFERTRVSNPQSMLDADFEYGLQPTKWQNLDILRGYPSIFEYPGTDLGVVAVVSDSSFGTSSVGASLMTVTTENAHGFTKGEPVTIKGLLNTVLGFARAEGTFVIHAVTANTFQYYGKAKVGPASVTTATATGAASSSSTTLTLSGTITGTFTVGMVITGTGIAAGTTIYEQVSGDVGGAGVYTLSQNTTGTVSGTVTGRGTVVSANYTQVRRGGFFTGASIGRPTFSVDTGVTPNKVTITFDEPHGLVPSDTIIVDITSTGSNHEWAEGPFWVEEVLSPTTLAYSARTNGTIGTGLTGVVYSRPDCFFVHRPYDGGVLIGTGGPAHGAHAIRQSKKYIRYQSGKAINFNTGILLAPNYDLVTVTANVLEYGSGTGSTVGVDNVLEIAAVEDGEFVVGQIVTGTNIDYNTRITSILTGTGGVGTYQLSKSTLGTVSGTVTAGAAITCSTDDVDHGMQVGAGVELIGVRDAGFNLPGYIVQEIIDERTLVIPAHNALTTLNASLGTPCVLALENWYGSTCRMGTFDDQNGQFWQFDGQTLAVGYRTGTFQVAGVGQIEPDHNGVTGINSRFLSQLVEGDKVIIKGMTHTVAQVDSDTQMYVTPDYRGVDGSAGAKMTKITEIIVPQSEWNIDRCDGSNGPYNPSGYNLKVNKMQMAGIQWTWYGAGFIEWMLRGPDGNFVPCHRIKASNVNTEAYMRSGNTPVRYEVLNESARSFTDVYTSDTDESLVLNDAKFFPNSGYVWVGGEVVRYRGKDGNTLINCSRGTSFEQFTGGETRTFTGGPAVVHPERSGVILINQTATPVISHWGSAFIQDGGFDSDRGYIFNYAATNITVSTRRNTAFAIRLAPSVSNAIIGDLGQRELLNRAQLLLQGIEVTAGSTVASGTGGIVVEGVLNPSNYPLSTATAYSSIDDIPLFTGSISGTTLTVSAVVVAGLTPGQYINGDGVAKKTYIISQLTGTTGGVGTYQVSVSQTVTSRDMTVSNIYWKSLQDEAGGGLPSFAQIGTAIQWEDQVRTETTAAGTNNSGSTILTVTSTTGAAVGDDIVSAAAGIQGGTKVTQVISGSQVRINKSLRASITAGTLIAFSRNAYAKPGETVFSYINSPLSRDTLDLSPLKELTNTPIGGRGVYPNGPDVLAINVYLTAGTAIDCNVVLRWGEAQA